MDQEYKYEISVLVITYNPNKEKLIYTINSILIQKDVLFEIVIADDGSKEDFFEEIKDYFRKRKFENVSLCKNQENYGTVKNINHGLNICKGKYIKLISPGDFLYGTSCLRNWLDYLKQEQTEVSFGDVIYYRMNKNKIEPVIHKALPQDVSIYKRYNQKVIDNYLLLDDTIHGVSTICSIKILKKYIRKIIGRVIYAEDCLYRILIKDGVKVSHYAVDVILYEFGDGISTNGNDIWKKMIKKDLLATDTLILQDNDGSKFYYKFKIAIDARDNECIIYKIKKFIIMPDLFFRKFRMKLCKRYTNINISDMYIDLIFTCDNACNQ